MSRNADYFLPCILVVAAAVFASLAGYATLVYLQGPGGAHWTPSATPVTTASTSLTPAPVSTAAASPADTLSACPPQLCEVRGDVRQCAAPADAGEFCVVSDLAPACALGVCAADARCLLSDAYDLTFACDCTCAGAPLLVDQ